MEQKEVKIAIPYGCEIDKLNSSFEKGNIVFKKKEKEVKTWDDLKGREVPSGCIINISANLNGVDHTWVFAASATDKGLFIDEKHAKSALAMAQISQLMPYYGGAISDNEWNDDGIIKYTICRKQDYSTFIISLHYEFLAFHTDEQRINFYKYNEQLVKDYLMIE